jgi:hypothetical protein
VKDEEFFWVAERTISFSRSLLYGVSWLLGWNDQHCQSLLETRFIKYYFLISYHQNSMAEGEELCGGSEFPFGNVVCCAMIDLEIIVL